MPRIEKVNQMIKREISSMLMLGEVKDPRVHFVTIISADVSKDLQYARIRFSMLSDDPKDIKSTTEGLNSCSSYIRKLLGQRIEMRYTPQIHFIYDKGVQYAVQVDLKLEEIKKLKSQPGDADEGN